MVDVNKFSERVIDLAERLADVSDAAKGKGVRRGSMSTRWVILPAAGAGLYALATSRAFSRRASGVIDEAKTRATDLPDDLMKRARNARKPARASGGQNRRQTSSRSKSSSAR